MTQIRYLLWIFTTSLALSPTLVAHSEPQSHILTETRAFGGTCLLGEVGERVPPAIIEAIVPSLINVTLNTLSTALREAAKARHYSERGTVNISGPEVQPDCIQLVHGKFYTHISAYNASRIDLNNLLGLDLDLIAKSVDRQQKENDVKRNLVDLGIYLADKPSFFLELAIDKSH